MPLALAWLGAALFAVSLGSCAYFYTVVLAQTGLDMGSAATLAAIAFDAALFSVFALHHSLLARTGAKQAMTRLLPQDFERSAYVWIASLLLLAVCGFWQALPGIVYELPSPWRWLGYALQAGGIVLTWQGAAVVDVLELAGVRQARHDVRPVVFRVVGPFRLVRHPIYLGWMLMVFSAPTMTTNRLVFATVSSLYLLLAIPWEERSLINTFGDRYRAYQATVRWRVLPGIW